MWVNLRCGEDNLGRQQSSVLLYSMLLWWRYWQSEIRFITERLDCFWVNRDIILAKYYSLRRQIDGNETTFWDCETVRAEVILFPCNRKLVLTRKLNDQGRTSFKAFIEAVCFDLQNGVSEKEGDMSPHLRINFSWVSLQYCNRHKFDMTKFRSCRMSCLALYANYSIAQPTC